MARYRMHQHRDVVECKTCGGVGEDGYDRVCRRCDGSGEQWCLIQSHCDGDAVAVEITDDGPACEDCAQHLERRSV